MKITRITKQKKNNSRYNIYTDDGNGEKYTLSVDEDLLVKYHLRKGLTLSQSFIETLNEQDTVHRSYAQVLNYLSYRMRSTQEIKDYLMRKGVDSEHIQVIIERLLDEGLVNDYTFAELFVKDRMQHSNKGPLFVKQELTKTKGIPEDIANEAIGQYTDEMQYRRALKIAEKRMKRQSNHSFKKQLQQLQATLKRNGFTKNIIEQIADECKIYKDESAEWRALCDHGERLINKYERKLTGSALMNKIKEGLYRQGFAMNDIYQYINSLSIYSSEET